jgi:protein-L-isoaspartate(D-aspartate) O-methyltransferase
MDHRISAAGEALGSAAAAARDPAQVVRHLSTIAGFQAKLGRRPVASRHDLRYSAQAMDIELAREFYAEEVRVAAHLRTPALAAAFARVARERFLPPGPWQLCGPSGLAMDYWTTEGDDPRHVYHNVAVAIDPVRQLNNGQPASLASWIDLLELRPGGRVLHIGCATGYYTAIMAEVVGPAGEVRALEVDAGLAAQARANLAVLPQVTVACADGWEADPGTRDAIFVNAGATHPNPRWLDALATGGCLLVPLTMTGLGGPLSAGLMLRVQRLPAGFAATFSSPVSIYPLSDGRSEEWGRRLAAAMATRQWGTLRSLRRDQHPAGETCFCHGEGLCLSRQEVG